MDVEDLDCNPFDGKLVDEQMSSIIEELNEALVA